MKGRRFCSNSSRAISRTSVICFGTATKGNEPLLIWFERRPIILVLSKFVRKGYVRWFSSVFSPGTTSKGILGITCSI